MSVSARTHGDVTNNMQRQRAATSSSAGCADPCDRTESVRHHHHHHTCDSDCDDDSGCSWWAWFLVFVLVAGFLTLLIVAAATGKHYSHGYSYGYDHSPRLRGTHYYDDDDDGHRSPCVRSCDYWATQCGWPSARPPDTKLDDEKASEQVVSQPRNRAWTDSDVRLPALRRSLIPQVGRDDARRQIEQQASKQTSQQAGQREP